MVDPEFWLDEEITSLDYEYRLFYIGTWNFSDDYGVVENSAKKLKAQIFPYDDVDCDKILDKLIKIKKLIPFDADGKKWLFIKKFLKYQRVDKPSRNRNPQAPKELLGEDYPTTPEPLNDEVKLREVKLSKDKRRESSNKDIKKFIKPTLQEIKEYCIQRENKVNHLKFFNHYESNGWKVGRNNMKNWKAAVRTWESSDFINNKTKSDSERILENQRKEDLERREKKENEKTNDKLRILSEQSKSLADKMSV